MPRWALTEGRGAETPAATDTTWSGPRVTARFGDGRDPRTDPSPSPAANSSGLCYRGSEAGIARIGLAFRGIARQPSDVDVGLASGTSGRTRVRCGSTRDGTSRVGSVCSTLGLAIDK
jgi:hypothetical protein